MGVHQRGHIVDLAVTDREFFGTHWLIPIEPNGVRRSYDPMGMPWLHRKFASLEMRFDSLARFATLYGHLGRAQYVLRGKDGRRHVMGECDDQWLSEVARMRGLLDVWDLVRDGSEAACRTLEERFVEVDDGMAMFREWGEMYPSEIELGLSGENHDFDASLHLIEVVDVEGLYGLDVRSAAHALLCSAVNEGLADGAHPAIGMPYAPGAVAMEPRDLLGAMYVHLAREMLDGGPGYEKCEGCGRWFVPRDPRQMYCEPKCKSKGYRSRKRGETNGK